MDPQRFAPTCRARACAARRTRTWTCATWRIFDEPLPLHGPPTGGGRNGHGATGRRGEPDGTRDCAGSGQHGLPVERGRAELPLLSVHGPGGVRARAAAVRRAVPRALVVAPKGVQLQWLAEF